MPKRRVPAFSDGRLDGSNHGTRGARAVAARRDRAQRALGTLGQLPDDLIRHVGSYLTPQNPYVRVSGEGTRQVIGNIAAATDPGYRRERTSFREQFRRRPVPAAVDAFARSHAGAYHAPDGESEVIMRHRYPNGDHMGAEVSLTHKYDPLTRDDHYHFWGNVPRDPANAAELAEQWDEYVHPDAIDDEDPGMVPAAFANNRMRSRRVYGSGGRSRSRSRR